MPTDPGIPRATGWKLHTPNALVGVRLAMAAVVFWILQSWSPGENRALLISAGLFALAALTDAADGLLARKWNAITRFGRVMDPFADKILVLGVFVLLAGPAFETEAGSLAGFKGWMVVLIVARELLVTSLRGLIEAGGGDFSASAAGKAKMIVQSLAVPIVLLVIGLDPWSDVLSADGSTARLVTAWVAWTTTIVTVLSGVPYILAASRATVRQEG